MGERVVTVGGRKATRPISDFMVAVQKEWYVGPNATGAGDDGRIGRSKETSLATLDYAIDLAVASTDSKNDKIYLLPGHTETISTAGQIALDKIGLRVINLGTGALAATFTFSATDATITMTAASCSIEGFPIFKPSIDAVVSPLVVSAADCKADIYLQDATHEIECVRAILTTAAADRFVANVKYRGFIAGDECDNAVRLVGVDTARINVDFYGMADVAIVEFHGTACHDIDITGNFYNDGTSLTKNVLDSVTGSTWSAKGWDGNSQSNFSGGDGVTLAGDDVGVVSAAVTVVDGLHDVPVADASTNLYMRDVVGIKTDAAAAGAVSSVESLMAYAKQNITLAIARDTAIGVVDAFHDVATANADTNVVMSDVVGNKTDTAVGTVDTVKTLMAYIKGILADTGADGVVLGADSITAAKIGDNALSEEHFDGDAVQAMTMGKKVSKATATLAATSTVDLFTVATGRVVVHAIVGEVTTVVQGQATSCKLISTPTTGTAADLCGALDLTADEAGCLYGITGLTGDALIGTNAGATICPKHGVVVPIGVIGFNNASAVNTGSVKWDIYYTPLDPGATIVSA